MYCQKQDVTLAGVFIAANVGELVKGSLFRGLIRKGCSSSQKALVQGSLLWFKKLEKWSPSDTKLSKLRPEMTISSHRWNRLTQPRVTGLALSLGFLACKMGTLS